MSYKGLEDGTFFFLEFTGSPPPNLLRRLIVNGVRRDELWSGRHRDWVPSKRLVPYDYNRGENDLVSITQEQVPEYVEEINATRDANAARNSRPFYFVRGDGTQDTDEFVMYRYGTDPKNLSETLPVRRSSGGAILPAGPITPQVFEFALRIQAHFRATGSLPESGVEPDPTARSLSEAGGNR